MQLHIVVHTGCGPHCITTIILYMNTYKIIIYIDTHADIYACTYTYLVNMESLMYVDSHQWFWAGKQSCDTRIKVSVVKTEIVNLLTMTESQNYPQESPPPLSLSYSLTHTQTQAYRVFVNKHKPFVFWQNKMLSSQGRKANRSEPFYQVVKKKAQPLNKSEVSGEARRLPVWHFCFSRLILKEITGTSVACVRVRRKTTDY